MATTESQLSMIESTDQLNLVEFVKNATWRELLIELIDTNKLDPWNIDIVKVVDGYVTVVKKMKVLDLHIPANIILAASILLRMKSDSLVIFKVEAEQIMEEPDAIQRVMPEIPQLVPRLRLQPHKRITLIELMHALDSAMRIKDDRQKTIQQATTPPEFHIPKDDSDERIESAYKLVESNVDNTGLITFARLANKFNHSESILLNLFVPLLYLVHKNRIVMMQEKFFDEIFIKLESGSSNARATTA